MKCDIPIELLSGYLDGVLDNKLKTAVEKHLKECESCRQELEELKRMDEYIKRQEVEEPSRDFVFALNRRVMEKIRRKPRPFLVRLTPVFAPAAIALLLFIVLINTVPRQRLIGIESRILYADMEIEREEEIFMAKPHTARAAAAKEKVYEREADRAAAPSGLVIAETEKKIDAVDEAMLNDFEVQVVQLDIPRKTVVRAIVDSTGKVLKVATGNTISPEKDTMLENRLEGQQLPPPTVAGRRTQLYVDYTAEEESND